MSKIEFAIADVEQAADAVGAALKRYLPGWPRTLGSNGGRARHETGVEVRVEWRLGLDGERWKLDGSVSLGGRDYTPAEARVVGAALVTAGNALDLIEAEFIHVHVFSIMQAREERRFAAAQAHKRATRQEPKS